MPTSFEPLNAYCPCAHAVFEKTWFPNDIAAFPDEKKSCDCSLFIWTNNFVCTTDGGSDNPCGKFAMEAVLAQAERIS